jgi:hypothetical protein
MSSPQEEAMWRIAMRNTAPSIKRLLEGYAKHVFFPETYDKLYLTFAYRKDTDITDPKNTIMIVKSMQSKKGETVPYDKFAEEGGSELQLLLDMFPSFYEHLDNQAKAWTKEAGKEITAFDIFLMIRCKKVEKPGTSFEETLDVRLVTKKSTGVNLQKPL